MAHNFKEMIIPIIIKMEVKKLINGVYTPDSVHLAAFRLSSVNGFELPVALQNAKDWGYRAKRGLSCGQDSNNWFDYLGRKPMFLVIWLKLGSTVLAFRSTIMQAWRASSMSGFIHFKDVGQASTRKSSVNFSIWWNPCLQKKLLLNQPSKAAAIIDYYYPGESVHYDQTLEKMVINGLAIYPELEIADMSS